MKLSGRLILIIVIFLLMLTGCGKKAVETDPGYYQSEYENDMDDDGGRYERVVTLDKAKTEDSYADTGQGGTETDPSAAGARMVHYNGYIKLRATKPSEVIDDVSERVTSAGGYIEQISGNVATFRVPVKQFRKIYKDVLGLGTVLEKEMTATDVTDSYTDLKQRIKIAREARYRYLELLSQTSDEEEKLRLLKEISRLTEEIEYLENSVKTITSLAEYSRLTLKVIPYGNISVRSHREDIAAFRWIYSLSPFTKTNALGGRKVRYMIPGGMVRLDNKKYWQVESAEGAALWAHKRKNSPAGDSEFWIKAIKKRLETDFATADVKSVGDYKLLRLTNHSEPRYVYCVAVSTRDDYLEVVEIYYPSANLEMQYVDSVTQSLVGGTR